MRGVERKIEKKRLCLVTADVRGRFLAEGVGQVFRILDALLVPPQVHLVRVLGDEGDALGFLQRQERAAAAQEAVMVGEAPDQRPELRELTEVPFPYGEGCVPGRLQDVGDRRRLRGESC